MDLASGETACLVAGQLTVGNTVVDAASLVVFAAIEAGRSCGRGARHRDGNGET
jgi:hypothetical protein